MWDIYISCHNTILTQKSNNIIIIYIVTSNSKVNIKYAIILTVMVILNAVAVIWTLIIMIWWASIWSHLRSYWNELPHIWQMKTMSKTLATILRKYRYIDNNNKLKYVNFCENTHTQSIRCGDHQQLLIIAIASFHQHFTFESRMLRPNSKKLFTHTEQKRSKLV